ncbi:Fe-S oxidoreductase [Solemya velum gill symbiont]|uniref:Fe-S oxidoreductase n=1 Tax=Solemya velum gill symbiont TaxID=2340 RepID=A0A0B0HBD9_SOVGS|nr:arsenosugar biosynthesis radical SAM (seleno)protein ArsS [Solemya velum gill symbiont]KHF24761.1 Fe-S oxidoreductase [Solemya velum gill symbiont]
MIDVLPKLNPGKSDFPVLYRSRLETLQVNLGYKCNQQCQHCHVNAGPNRTEEMSAETAGDILNFLESGTIRQLDLTGGAPEIHAPFRQLVEKASALGVHVIDRCNLTVLSEPGQESLAEFLAQYKVEVVASLPCYLEENVDSQRGKGVFTRSIDALRQLNSLGYGVPGSGLELTLMYNPVGSHLPPSQESLEDDYRQKLRAQYGVEFSRLFTLVNMPIQRFGSMLVSKGEFDGYMQLLRSSFAAENLQSVMCRTLISVDWQGYVYDCDFNQMIGLPLGKERLHIKDIDTEGLTGSDITMADHCYGCTAGQGSSCGGALA